MWSLQSQEGPGAEGTDKSSALLRLSPGRKSEACLRIAVEEHCWFILFHNLAPFLPAKQPIPKTSSCWMLAATSTRAGWALFPNPGKWRGPGCVLPAPMYMFHANNLTHFPSCNLLLGLLHVAHACLVLVIPQWSF